MNIAEKRIIFFDGDGTLWYPRATEWREKPFWVYFDENTKDSYLEHLTLTPRAVETLEKLRVKGVKTVILSTHPQEPDVAAAKLGEKVRHLGLETLFDEVYATANYIEAKGEKMLEVLGRLSLSKKDALMVGDFYEWDYLSAHNQGIDAVLIDSDYHQAKKDEEPAEFVIADLDELLG